MASKQEYRLDLTFDREITEDFEHHYELTARRNIVAKLRSNENLVSKLIVIEKQLRGKATRLVRGLPDEGKATVTALYGALTKKYVNSRAIQSYALAFDQASQQPREELYVLEYFLNLQFFE